MSVIAAVPLSLYVSIYSVVFTEKVMKIFTAASIFFSSGNAQIFTAASMFLNRAIFCDLFFDFFLAVFGDLDGRFIRHVGAHLMRTSPTCRCICAPTLDTM